MKFVNCEECPLSNGCNFVDLQVPKHRFSTLSEFIDIAMHYRSQGFYSFRGHRNRNWELGVSFKLRDMSVAEMEDALVRFKTRCLALPSIDPIPEDDEWRWMFVAQHYGLRTKLLDWTSNPLVALYFSVENVVSKLTDDISGVVWALKVDDRYFLTQTTAGHPDYDVHLNELGKEIRKRKEYWYMVNPAPITNRIERQSGKFSYFPDPNQLITDEERVHIRGRELVMLCLRPLSNGETIRKIRQQLGIMNVHHAAMFPDRAGIARFLNEEIRILNPETGEL